MLGSNKHDDSYYFFPYRGCLLLTVKAVSEFSDYGSPSVRIKAKVNDVLRGDFKRDSEIEFSTDEPDNRDWLGYPLNQIVGKQCVLAFHYGIYVGEGLSFHNIYVPFKNQQFTSADVCKLRAKLRNSVYPYRACLVLSIQRFRKLKQVGYYTDNPEVVTARIEDVFLGDPRYPAEKAVDSHDLSVDHVNFRKGQLFRGVIPSNVPMNVFPHGSKKYLVGSRCVWEFNPSLITDGCFYLKDLHSPFPNQTFARGDLAKLKISLDQNSRWLSALRRSVQTYLERRWTPERIRKFCRPETRMIPGVAGLWPGHCDLFLTGKLYPKLQNELGSVTWYLCINDGQADDYEFQIDRGGLDYWRVINRFSLDDYTDEDFKKEIIGTSLMYPIYAYDRVHWKNERETNDHIPKSMWSFVKNDLNEITDVKSTLASGKQFDAKIDKQLKIQTVLIDGKPDPIWHAALTEYASNLQVLLDRTGGRKSNAKH